MIDQREVEFTKSSTSTYYRAEIISKASPSSSTTTSWSKLKDPRIVRVSRSSGGKDRHSKVYTVRGLRDRRIRLSVPTAIQLYDLQERLGLNQPSKVVDWLLNVAKNEIDTLPPLQFPQESLVSDNLRPMLTCRGASFGEENTQEHQGAYASPYNSVLKRDLNSDLSLSHDPNNSDLHNFGLVPLPSTFSVPSGSSQALMYHQPGLSTQSYFHPQINSIDQELVQRQFQFLSSNVSPFTSSIMPTTQPIRPLPFNISTANLFLHSQNNSDQNKGFHI